MKKINSLLFVIVMSCICCTAQEKVIWRENFDSFKNWQPVRQYEKDEFKVENNELTAVCAHIPYKGSYYQCEIPYTEQGELTFEVNINAAQAGNYKHLSLQVKLYSLTTSFNGYGGSKWQRFDGKSWLNLTNIKNGEWIKCKIVFDSATGAVEYYAGDMENPVQVETDLKLSKDKNGKAFIGIGNYGLAAATIINKVRNMQLTSGREAANVQSIRAKTAMLFRGIAFNSYQLDKVIAAAGITEVEQYDVTNLLNLDSKNRFRLDKLPSPKRKALPEYIIMADVPLSGDCIPEYAQKMIAKNIEKGGKLLILGGMFTLNKGDFAGSHLGKLVSSDVNSQWQIIRCEPPSKIHGLGEVKFLHPVKITENTTVLAKAGNQPFIVSTSYGAGRVITCLGMPCGSIQAPFWESSAWPRYIAQFVN